MNIKQTVAILTLSGVVCLGGPTQAETGHQAQRQARRIVKRNITELRRLSPTLDQVYRNARRADRKENVTMIQVAGSLWAYSALHTALSSWRLAEGDWKSAAVIAIPAVLAPLMSAPAALKYFSSSREAGERAVLRRLSGNLGEKYAAQLKPETVAMMQALADQ